jgi:hypothetical protein
MRMARARLRARASLPRRVRSAWSRTTLRGKAFLVDADKPEAEAIGRGLDGPSAGEAGGRRRRRRPARPPSRLTPPLAAHLHRAPGRVRDRSARPRRSRREDGPRPQRRAPAAVPPAPGVSRGDRAYRAGAVRRDGERELERARADAGGRGPRAVPDRRDARTQRREPRHPSAILASAHLHPREAIQYLTDSALDAVDGKLQDDASSLCFDWHGGAQRNRVAHAGAEHRTPRERHSPRRLSRADGPAKRVASLGPQA